MHSIAEVVIPPGRDVELAVSQVMSSFLEEDDDGNKTDSADWWDFWKIGGRFSGDKTTARLDPDKLKAFYAMLTEKQVTVSGLRAGKPDLSPASQIPQVDAWWREWFPGAGDACPLFGHSRDKYRSAGYYPDDVCLVRDVPAALTCERLIVAVPHYDAAKRDTHLTVRRMLVKSFWNGVQWQDTRFDGLVGPALAGMTLGRVAAGSDEEAKVGDDWQVVTVDYHN